MPRLRAYHEADWPHLLALELETAEDSLGDTTDRERAVLRERWPKLLAEQLRTTHPELWVMEGDAGKYLGHLWLSEKTGTLDGARVLEVTTMGIVKEARGQGLGRVLMQKAASAAREKKIEIVELSVAGNNRRARDLYRDLGYETTRRTMRMRLHE